MSTSVLFNEFTAPSVCFKGKPFWSWNDLLEEDELRRQIRIFKEMGFGGFFMHSRLGLATPYLSREWFDRVKACVDEAQKIGLEAWLYDEDRYPSGAAGGFATQDPQFRRHILFMTRCPAAEFVWPEDTGKTFIYAAAFQQEKILFYRRLKHFNALKTVKADEEIITFHMQTMPNMSWFNNGTYLDTMNPEAISKFIDITHEAYRREVGEHFGKTIPGMFTDEPNPGPMFREWFDNDGGDVSMAWTPRFPEQFQVMFSYDLLDHLPEIPYDLVGQPVSRARYHYHLCKCRLFVEACAKPMGQWCEKNNLLLTGHTLLEEPGSDNLTMGAAHMQFYPYMQAPGIDVLTEFEPIYMTAKQAVSVAHQVGRTWVLSELYGGTGWNATFDTYKHIGDWQAALGITLRCPHLSFYSMAGEAKRDFPASIHFQSPWWKQYANLENYYSRLHTVLTAGEPVCDLAVLHPTESYYIRFNKQWANSTELKQMDADYNQLTRWLLGHHLDFDFADEHLLTELDCLAGQDDQGPYLQIGLMKYRAILIPPLITMRQITLDRLRQFEHVGGCILFTGQPPAFVDALPNDAAVKFAKNKIVPFDGARIAEALAGTVGRVSIRDAQRSTEIQDIFYQLRHIKNDWAIFLVNTNRKKNHTNIQIQISLPEDSIRQMQMWDALKGHRYEVPFSYDKGRIKFSIDLCANGSCMLIAAEQPEVLPLWEKTGIVTHEITVAPDAWDYQRDEPNVLLLDCPDCIAGSDTHERYQCCQMEILRLDAELRHRYKIEKRGGHMLQPWVSRNDPLIPSIPVCLTYRFEVDVVPQTDRILLAIEQPQRWTIQLNGKKIKGQNINGWWVDPAIATLPIACTLLQRGLNTLTLQGNFDRKANLERLYLLGDFGVSINTAKVTMTSLPKQLAAGSWIKQGLPFYSGAISYSSDFDLHTESGCRYFLDLQNSQCALAEIRLNDCAAIIMAFNGEKTDITHALRSGKNKLHLTLISSRQNAFGPLHLPEDHPVCVGPHSYKYDAKNWCPGYHLTEYGLKGPIWIGKTTAKQSESEGRN